MKSVPLKILNKIDIEDTQRVYSSMVRFSFNRFQEGLKEKDIRKQLKEKFPPNSWLQQNAIKDAAAMYEKFGDKKIVFGSKKRLFRYLEGKITKDEYKEGRMRPILIQGEKRFYGNRFFNLTRLSESSIEIKFSKKDHQKVIFAYPHSKDLDHELRAIEQLCRQKKLTVTVKLTKDTVTLTYDEKLVRDELRTFKNLKKNRVLSIDMNPKYIGLSVLEFNNGGFKVLFKQLFDVSEFHEKQLNWDSLKTYYLGTEKRHYELIKIAHAIKDLVGYWKCSKLVLEDLNIKPKDNGNKSSNRQINNFWNRDLFSNKLKMLGNVYGFDVVEINPAYSSFVGNVLHGDENTPDPVAASIEIGRRGYNKFKKGWFYPKFDARNLKELWKQTLDGCRTWVEAFQKTKTLDMKYRVQLEDCIPNAVCRLEYTKKHTVLYAFR